MNKKKKRMSGVAALLCVLLPAVALLTEAGFSKDYRQTKLESKLPKQRAYSGEEKIRVLLKTNGFLQTAHAEVRLQADSGLRITSGERVEETEGGQVCSFTPADGRFQSGTIAVESRRAGEQITVSSVNRGYGAPSYRGKLELFGTAEGVVIVNELPLEEYLYAVVPSEMPSSFEEEALKAQAVCARSYAYNQSRNYAYPEYRAHVDDSTSFQVYGNAKEAEAAIRAVDLTRGEMLWHNGQVATAYYYSTSCGKTASLAAWGSDPGAAGSYLGSIDVCDENGVCYEAALPWYRWTAVIPEKTLSDLVELNTGTEIGTLLNLAVTEKGDGGIVQEITAVGTTGKVVVRTEHKIRSALGGSGYQIEKQDGTVVDSTKLLPSAFFSVEKKNGKYILHGGGYGHGVGMSQNGANEMAKRGKTYRQILQLFYTGADVK